jgi:hypothetical protein
MELTRIKKSVASLAIAGSLFGGTVLGVAAAPPERANNNGAAGVVAAAVQALNNINIRDNVVDVAVVEINDSLNNSLNNLTALNNFLNGSPILSNNNVTIGDVNVDVLTGLVTVGDITLTDIQVTALNNFLNESNILITDVIGIAVLSGGDLLVFTN